VRLNGSLTVRYILGAKNKAGRESVDCGDEWKKGLDESGDWDLHFGWKLIE
jgi:hypothetical protein